MKSFSNKQCWYLHAIYCEYTFKKANFCIQCTHCGNYLKLKSLFKEQEKQTSLRTGSWNLHGAITWQ